MVKKFLVALIFCYMLFSAFAQNRSISETQKDELLALMAYVQYASIRIKQEPNKLVADEMFDFILNDIDQGKLFNEDMRTTFGDLLAEISSVKLNDNEKHFYEMQEAEEQKAARYEIFNSFGSVFVPGKTPKQMIATLLYTGASAYSNYRRAQSNIKIKYKEKQFKIEQTNVKQIDYFRTQFYTAGAKILTDYHLDSKKSIVETEMEDFLKTIQNDNAVTKIAVLNNEKLKNTFSNFAPFWYELGKAYQENGDIENALKYYQQYEQVQSRINVLRYDSTYVDIAKNIIAIKIDIQNVVQKDQIPRLSKNDQAEMYRCLELIKKHTAPSPTEKLAETNYYMAQVYYLLGNTQKAESLLKININYGKAAPLQVEPSRELLRIIKTTDTRYGEIYQFLYKAKDIEFSGHGKNNEGHDITIRLPEAFADEYELEYVRIYLRKENFKKAAEDSEGVYTINFKKTAIPNEYDLDITYTDKKSQLFLFFFEKQTGKKFIATYNIGSLICIYGQNEKKNFNKIVSKIDTPIDGITKAVLAHNLYARYHKIPNEKEIEKETKNDKTQGQNKLQEWIYNAMKDSVYVRSSVYFTDVYIQNFDSTYVFGLFGEKADLFSYIDLYGVLIGKDYDNLECYSIDENLDLNK